MTRIEKGCIQLILKPSESLTDNFPPMPKTNYQPDTRDKTYAPTVKAIRSRTSGLEATSRRRMSLGRHVWYFFVIVLTKLVARLMWWTCRIEKIIGEEHMERILAKGKPVILCFWHQMHLFCSYYMLQLIERGMNVGFLISPSVSGEVPTGIAKSWGAKVLRGSPTRTGGQALRDMHQAICRDGISPVITVDGPKGPVHQVKPGVVLLARLTKTPMVPLAYAADRATYWNSWDRFIVPRPFSRIVIAIGEPLSVPSDTPVAELEPFRRQMEHRLKTLTREAQDALR